MMSARSKRVWLTGVNTSKKVFLHDATGLQAHADLGKGRGATRPHDAQGRPPGCLREAAAQPAASVCLARGVEDWGKGRMQAGGGTLVARDGRGVKSEGASRDGRRAGRGHEGRSWVVVEMGNRGFKGTRRGTG